MKKINFKKISLLVTISLSFIILLNLISASGCCFNPTNGLCSRDSTTSTCTNSGIFFNSPTCDVTECALGCCSLGTNTMFITERDCQLRSQNGGFQENFQTGLTIEQCTALGTELETGACLYGDYAPFDCNIKTQAECASGRFYANLTCTSAELNTRCNVTTKTICNNGDVYFKDSCENPDTKKETCDYESGKICATESSDEAYCKDLNCNLINGTAKNNGEKWCTPAEINVGGRFFSQYCLNGNVFTEPCADYRQEYCLDGPFIDIFGDEREIPTTGGECEENPWSGCFEANSELTSETGTDATSIVGEERMSKLEESCEPDFCQIFEPEMAPTTKTGLTPEQIRASTELLGSLGLELCLPRIQPGMELSTRVSSASSEESICSAGDFTQNVVFRVDTDSQGLRTTGNTIGDIILALSSASTFGVIGAAYGLGHSNDIEKWGLSIEDPSGNSATASLLQQYEAMTTGTTSDWYDWEQIYTCTSGNNYCRQADEDATSLPVNPSVLAALEARCTALGDCGGKTNWVGVGGSGGSSGSGGEMILTSNAGWKKTYTFTYTCMPWKAPAGGEDCGKCGQDGLACSEYRCKSLGKKCEYFEPAGIDLGVCVSSDDNSPPAISLKSIIPPSPIRPFTPVEISITTDEISECRFNLNNAGARYSDMDYSFEESYGTEHKVKLNLPGQIESIYNITEFPLITRDGNYTMYVRCLDAAGNGETMVAYPIHFEVMKTPDTSISLPTNFNPISGSSIIFNTTTKNIEFKTNEPVMCRWSFEDKDYSSMENEFACEFLATPNSLINGYGCSGTLTNVTLTLGEETNYYIRCKDQPWIENESMIINNVTYSRNKNSESYNYKLRPSQKLEITDISPGGYNQISGLNATFQLRTVTRGGVLNGQATCYWRISNNESAFNSAFTIFSSTNSNSHSQILTDPYLILGDRIMQVKCNDNAGNEEIKNQSFTLEIDAGTPRITRVMYQNNNLRIQTDEESVCYYSLNKTNACDYSILNATLMSGFDKMHTTAWISDRIYYLKCKDFFGNKNENNCAGIIKTYYKL